MSSSAIEDKKIDFSTYVTSGDSRLSIAVSLQDA